MYSYNFLEKYPDIFVAEKAPLLTRLSHSYDNPNWSANYHVHSDEIELAYVEDGLATYSLDIESFTVQAGDLIVIEPGVLHGLTSDFSRPASIWTIGLKNFQLKGIPQPLTILRKDAFPILPAAKQANLIASLLSEINRQHQLGTLTGKYLCKQLAQILLILYYQAFQKCRIQERAQNSSFARDIMIYINFHYAKKVTLESLAAIFHRSEDHISHEFKNVYGISPINYAIDRRICEAKWLLINTLDSLAVVSEQIGYENVNYFTNLFTKKIGMTPTEYRHTYGKKN